MHWLRWHLTPRFPSLAALLPRRMLSVVPLEHRCNSKFIRDLTLAAGLLLCLAVPSRADWHHFPVGEASVNSLAADSAGQRIVVGLYGAGFWTSGNGGTLWNPSNSALAHAFPIWPQDAEALDALADTIILQAGTTRYSGGQVVQAHAAWRTFDGGRTWSVAVPPSNGSSDWCIIPSKRNHQTWFFIEPGRICRSSNAGASWSMSVYVDGFYPLYRQRSVYEDPSGDSTLFLISPYDHTPVGDFGGLLRSDDLGATWSTVIDFFTDFGLESAYPSAVTRLSNGELMVFVETYTTEWPRREILVSSDDGASWSWLFPNLPPNFNPESVVEDQSQPGTLFVVGYNHYGMYRSEDFGRMWQPALLGVPAPPYWCNALSQNPFSAAIYLMTDVFGTLRTTDHGATWQHLPLPPVGGSGPLTIEGGSVFVNSNHREWRLSPPYISWQDFRAPSTPETLRSCSDIVYNDEDMLVIMTGVRDPGGPIRSQLAWSPDHGVTWEVGPVLPFYADGGMNTVGSIPSSRTISYSYDHDLLVSHDLGLTWISAELPCWCQTVSLQQNDSSIFVIADRLDTLSAYNVLRTTDEGVTWQNLQYPSSNVPRGDLLLGEDLLVLSDDTYLRWSSGAWQTRGHVPEYRRLYWTTSVPGNPMFIIGFGESDSLWQSSDTCITWQLRDYTLPYASQSDRIDRATYDTTNHRLWIVAGTGVCYLDASELSSPGPLHFVPADFTVLAAYPNPFNPITRICFDLLQTAKVELDIFDLQGRLVQTLVDGIQQSGRHEIAFDGSALASGTYFVRLQSPATTKAQKVLLLK